eukprot:CAMPEP_0205829604 /NCGR_PEP_ID=MMETSP0206-20130828/38645_1 /ASSEMBLY_ACC=CAM_ASM_000279 /TAXON_ID=36767 /ORGANISM="Euplotes focardii, Strain TN1" /LENGTH=130 /DNA_ID=CAMNT_0053132465 /DNA_START=1083 /DNA_END=1472 /DNA_ORIENTATION=+
MSTGMYTDNTRYFSKTKPVVNNVKTALEVPPIDGEDYINPVYSRRLEESMSQMGDQTPQPPQFTQTIGTGLAENVPGHDSILLTKSRTEAFTPNKKDDNMSTKASTFARSRNLGIGPKSRTEVPKSVSFR